jgi:OmpA-OmpF porin, OOP family
MKLTTLTTSIALLAISVSAYAGTDSKDMKQMAPAPVPSDAGFYVAVFGGANVAQDYGDRHGTASDSPLFSSVPLTISSGSNVGGVGGLKFGYKFDSIPLDPGMAVQPAVEAEAFYLGTTPHFNYHGTAALTPPPTSLTTFGTVKDDLDSAAFFVNGIFRLKTGTIFTPYVGIGVGAEYLSLSSGNGTDVATVTNVRGGVAVAHGNGPVGGDDDVVFATQGLAGFDIEIAKNWDLFTEYKFVVGIDPSFNVGNVGTFGGTAVSGTINPSYIGQHLVTAGIKYNF